MALGIQISKSIGTLLGKLSNTISKNKKLLGAGGIGVGVGLATNMITDDGHDKSDHTPKKYAAVMTPMEKADQKYAIAKSYEREGHPRKAKEYKDKASKAYKRAWEKRASAVGSKEYNLASIWHVGTFNTSSTAKKSNYRAKLLDKDKEGYNYIQVFDKKSNKPYKTWKVVPGEGKDDSPAVLLQEQKRAWEKKSAFKLPKINFKNWTLAKKIKYGVATPQEIRVHEALIKRFGSRKLPSPPVYEHKKILGLPGHGKLKYKS